MHVADDSGPTREVLVREGGWAAPTGWKLSPYEVTTLQVNFAVSSADI